MVRRSSVALTISSFLERMISFWDMDSEAWIMRGERVVGLVFFLNW